MRREALRLVNTGESCLQIGEALGVMRQRAWQLVTEEMDFLAAETFEVGLKCCHKQTVGHESRLESFRK